MIFHALILATLNTFSTLFAEFVKMVHCQTFYLHCDTTCSTISVMSKQNKKMIKMEQNPRNWRIEDLKSVADAHGVEWVHDGGSHVVFRDKQGAHLTVPASRPIKPIYVKHFVALIKRGI